MPLRKSVTGSIAARKAIEPLGDAPLDIERVAQVEVTSEDPEAPIDGALLGGDGWRAGGPGPQRVRLVFDAPQRVRHIELVFAESETPRTQEFCLRWSADHGRSFREIVRQQWNFSPSGATMETEHYDVDLAGVTVIELEIVPDVSGGSARASLHRWRIA